LIPASQAPRPQSVQNNFGPWTIAAEGLVAIGRMRLTRKPVSTRSSTGASSGDWAPRRGQGRIGLGVCRFVARPKSSRAENQASWIRRSTGANHAPDRFVPKRRTTGLDRFRKRFAEPAGILRAAAMSASHPAHPATPASQSQGRTNALAVAMHPYGAATLWDRTVEDPSRRGWTA